MNFEIFGHCPQGVPSNSTMHDDLKDVPFQHNYFSSRCILAHNHLGFRREGIAWHTYLSSIHMENMFHTRGRDLSYRNIPLIQPKSPEIVYSPQCVFSYRNEIEISLENPKQSNMLPIKNRKHVRGLKEDGGGEGSLELVTCFVSTTTMPTTYFPPPK